MRWRFWGLIRRVMPAVRFKRYMMFVSRCTVYGIKCQHVSIRQSRIHSGFLWEWWSWILQSATPETDEPNLGTTHWVYDLDKSVKFLWGRKHRYSPCLREACRSSYLKYLLLVQHPDCTGSIQICVLLLLLSLSSSYWTSQRPQMSV